MPRAKLDWSSKWQMRSKTKQPARRKLSRLLLRPRGSVVDVVAGVAIVAVVVVTVAVAAVVMIAVTIRMKAVRSWSRSWFISTASPRP